MAPLHRTLLALALLALGTSACPSPEDDPECRQASDCAALSQGSCTACVPSSPTFCEEEKCVTPAEATTQVRLDMTTPRNLAMSSIRFVVISPKGATSSAVTCEDIQRDGMGAAHFNVALSGFKGTETSNGTINQFPDIDLGKVPRQTGLLAVEGRTLPLGNGDPVAFACTSIQPQSDLLETALLLQAL